jgi:hypothetical protein
VLCYQWADQCFRIYKFWQLCHHSCGLFGNYDTMTATRSHGITRPTHLVFTLRSNALFIHTIHSTIYNGKFALLLRILYRCVQGVTRTLWIRTPFAKTTNDSRFPTQKMPAAYIFQIQGTSLQCSHKSLQWCRHLFFSAGFYSCFQPLRRQRRRGGVHRSVVVQQQHERARRVVVVVRCGRCQYPRRMFFVQGSTMRTLLHAQPQRHQQ